MIALFGVRRFDVCLLRPGRSHPTEGVGGARGLLVIIALIPIQVSSAAVFADGADRQRLTVSGEGQRHSEEIEAAGVGRFHICLLDPDVGRPRENIDRSGLLQRVVIDRAVHAPGAAVLCGRRHGECPAIAGQRHAPTEIVTKPSVGRLDVGLLRPHGAGTIEYVDGARVAGGIVQLVAVHARCTAVLEVRADSQNRTICGQRDGNAEAIAGDCRVGFRIGGLHVGLLDPRVVGTHEHVHSSREPGSSIALVAIDARRNAALTRRADRHRPAVGGQRDRGTEPRNGLRIGSLEIADRIGERAGHAHRVRVEAAGAATSLQHVARAETTVQRRHLLDRVGRCRDVCTHLCESRVAGCILEQSIVSGAGDAVPCEAKQLRFGEAQRQRRRRDIRARDSDVRDVCAGSARAVRHAAGLQPRLREDGDAIRSSRVHRAGKRERAVRADSEIACTVVLNHDAADETGDSAADGERRRWRSVVTATTATATATAASGGSSEQESNRREPGKSRKFFHGTPRLVQIDGAGERPRAGGFVCVDAGRVAVLAGRSHCHDACVCRDCERSRKPRRRAAVRRLEISPLTP